MSTIRITLFGKFSMSHCGQKLAIIEARKLQELLCYLLIFRDHSYSRESIAGLFWGESSIAQSKKYLRQALWQLQSILHPFFEKETTPLLITELDPNCITDICGRMISLVSVSTLMRRRRQSIQSVSRQLNGLKAVGPMGRSGHPRRQYLWFWDQSL